MIITSRENGKYKFINSLKVKKNRTREKKFILEGEKVIVESLELNGVVKEIAFSKSFFENSKNTDTVNSIINHKLEYSIFTDELFNKLSETMTPQGILAVCKSNLREVDTILPFGRYILVDGLNDPGNLGGIIRSIDAFGLDGIIIGPGTVDPYNDKVIRSTMASIFRVLIYKMDSKEQIMDLKKLKFKIFSASLRKSVSIYEAELSDNFVLIIGNEANGVSEYLEDSSDESISIPIIGDAESLNANVAASIFMYESTKQRGGK
ncbi:MAG: RNA methyltransferase [Tissierellia bacterium]|nr:RNA methyltransferase [Tissierellia bacterium]